MIEFPITYIFPDSNNTEEGDSGSLVLASATNGSFKIVGLHTAFKHPSGIATPLYREDIDGLLQLIEVQGKSETAEPSIETQSGYTDIGLEIIRRVPPQEAHFPPSKSKHRRSCFIESKETHTTSQ